jgi:hypothetical protein
VNQETDIMDANTRHLINLTDEEIEARFEDLGYLLTIDDLYFTSETVDDYRAARLGWINPGEIDEDEPGLLVVKKAQAMKGQPRKDVVVIDFGSGRAVMAQ